MAATEPITLVPVGPLTNIAMAIKLEPRIVERIPATVIMGGAHASGNTTPAAEFNIWVDPEAARVVFGAGLANVTLVPLDATHRALVSSEDCERLRALGTPAGDAAAAFIEGRIAAYDTLQPMDTLRTAPVHDALCVAYLVDPTVVSGQRAHVDVETRGELTIGRTVIDTRGSAGSSPTPSSRSMPMRRSSCRCCSRRSPVSLVQGPERRGPTRPSVRRRPHPRSPGRCAWWPRRPGCS